MPVPRTTNRFAAWWQLLRAGNVFTVPSNVVIGYLLAGGSWYSWRDLALLVASSVLLYEAGMVLNDRFDLERDRCERPERPIPSGRVTLRAASRAGWLLLAGGILFACLAGWFAGSARPPVVGSLLATAIVGYDAGLKRFWPGSLVMGCCRALNVLLGASLVPEWPPALGLVALAIGLYTVGLTLFARNESRTGPRLPLYWGSAIALAGMGLMVLLPAFREIHLSRTLWGLLWACWIVWTAFACWRAIANPSPKNVRSTVARLLKLFVVIDSVLGMAISGPTVALAILSLLIPMRLASRWAPMT